MHLRSIPFTTTLTILLATAVAGTQDIRHSTGQRYSANQRYNVTFHERSFDLGAFGAAVRARVPAARLDRIVRDLEAAVRRDQAAFVARIHALGGLVHDQWWIINGCCVELPAERVAAARGLPNVAAIVPDEMRHAHLAVATNAAHHASDQANLKKDKSGRKIIGTGISVAVLDTGADADSGQTKRPHLCYYPDGNPNNNKNGGIQGSLLLETKKVAQSPSGEDTDGHGTAVAGCLCANRWNGQSGVDNGVAPGAGLVSINITNSAGISADSWIVTAWQMTAAMRRKHNIGVGNNSFAGSPMLSNVAQQALDSLALNADMLICVSAGNRQKNTTESQHAFNGLAVGSVDKTFLSRSSFSAIGPLRGTSRTYPDITAVGNAMTTVLRDNESSSTTLGGTSYAAPLVAGAAALLRQANPALSATEVKAILLDTTVYRSNNRNEYGIGFMKVDRAVDAALTGEVVTGAVATDKKVSNFEFRVGKSGNKSITIAWMRTKISSATVPNLDLRIYDGNNKLVAQDLNPANSYEHVRFFASNSVTYRAEVTWVNPPAQGTALQEFAIAGATNRSAPVLARSTPASVTSYHPGVVELTGSGLATVSQLEFGGKATAFTVMDDTRIRFEPPHLFPIGKTPIVVTNPLGRSQPFSLRIRGQAKPLMVGPSLVVRGPKNVYQLFSDRSWLSLLMVSLSNKPSKLPGIFDLGIGNGFTSLVSLVYLNQDTSGASSITIVYPSVIPRGTKVFFQALSVDAKSPTLPYPASNVLPVQIF